MLSESMEFLEGYLANQRYRGFSPKTIKRRRMSLTRFLRSVGSTPLAEVTPRQVQAFVAPAPTPASRRAYLGDIRNFYRWLIREEAVTVNPTDRVDPPKVPNRLPTPVRADDLRRMIDAATGDTLTMLLLGAHAGLRVSEIARLHTDDVDFAAGTLTVRDGKGGKDGVVPLTPVLAAHLATLPPGPVVEASHPDSVGCRLRRHYLRCGVRGRVHDLRHSYGTEAARVSNGNVMLVQKLMRHSNIVTSMRYIGFDPATATIVAEMYPEAS